MSFARAVRVAATSAVVALVLGAVGTTAAEAKPAPAPTGLKATVTAHSGGTYDVAASWNATPSATSYRVALSKGGVTLSSSTVSTTAWTPTVTTTPGTGSLTVRALVGKKPGRTATLSVPLPDVTPPTAAYTTSWDNPSKVATLTEAALSDDSPVSQISRTVDWGDGTVVSWPAGVGFPNDALQHTYTTVDRFVPTVTLTDAAGNHTTVTAPAVVIDDVTPPSGTFSLSPTTAWADLTRVKVTQTALADDKSPAAGITRVIDWGDGTAPESWPAGAGFPGDSLPHVYAQAGTFQVTETLTDEAHNEFVTPVADVTVEADTVAPLITFRLPKARHSVRAFRSLRGKATDTGGTGVATVTLKAVEKRGRLWYGYNARTHKWLKAATKARAFARARSAVVTTNRRHVWTVGLARLRTGTLVYRAFAKDRVANKSAPRSHRAVLTHR